MFKKVILDYLKYFKNSIWIDEAVGYEHGTLDKLIMELESGRDKRFNRRRLFLKKKRRV